MCMLCVEFQKGNMTIREAKNALIELVNSKEAMKIPEFWHYVSLDESDDLEGALNEHKEG